MKVALKAFGETALGSLVFFYGVPFVDYNYEALASCIYHTGHVMITGNRWFGGIKEKERHIGFTSSSHSAEYAKLLYAALNLTATADTGGIDKLNGAVVVAQVGAGNVARCARNIGNNSLLLTNEGI